MAMTTKEKQCLLFYLKYYTGAIDGDWGAQSKAATVAFQKATGLTPDGIFGAKTEERILQAVAKGEKKKVETAADKNVGNKTGTFWASIKHFNRSEYACKCGKCGGFPVEPEEKLVRAEDKVREHFGVPVNNSSGVRCVRHNAAVGGVSDSRHLAGKAVDFCVRGFSASSVLPYVQSLSEIRYAYAIDRNYVHMDID